MSLDDACRALIDARDEIDARVAELDAELDDLARDRAALEQALGALNGVPAVPLGPQRRANPGPVLVPTRERIIAAFADPVAIWKPKELAHHLDVPVASVSQHLTRLVKDGIVERFAAGHYRAPHPAPEAASPPGRLVLGPADVRDPGRGSHEADGKVLAVPLDTLGPMRTIPYTQEHARGAAT